MAHQTGSSVTIAAEPAVVLDVIADFAAYPSWASEIKAVRVLGQEEGGWPRQVEFTVDAGIVQDTYVLDYSWDLASDHTGTVSWHLVESSTLKALDGAYVLERFETGTAVTYTLTVDLKIPLPGMLRRKGERTLVDTALRGLKRRVETGE